jgi:hypothetical protein
MDRRRRTRALGVVNAAAVFLMLVGFFVLTALPRATPPAVAERAPDFELPDHQGDRFSLGRALADGPILLVFYRGHW